MRYRLTDEDKKVTGTKVKKMVNDTIEETKDKLRKQIKEMGNEHIISYCECVAGCYGCVFQIAKWVKHFREYTYDCEVEDKDGKSPQYEFYEGYKEIK